MRIHLTYMNNIGCISQKTYVCIHYSRVTVSLVTHLVKKQLSKYMFFGAISGNVQQPRHWRGQRGCIPQNVPLCPLLRGHGIFRDTCCKRIFFGAISGSTDHTQQPRRLCCSGKMPFCLLLSIFWGVQATCNCQDKRRERKREREIEVERERERERERGM